MNYMLAAEAQGRGGIAGFALGVSGIVLILLYAYFTKRRR